MYTNKFLTPLSYLSIPLEHQLKGCNIRRIFVLRLNGKLAKSTTRKCIVYVRFDMRLLYSQQCTHKTTLLNRYLPVSVRISAKSRVRLNSLALR